MKIELQSTSQIIRLNGIECRVWEGKTAGGLAISACIALVRVDAEADSSELERELRETPQPRPTDSWPLRMVL